MVHNLKFIVYLLGCAVLSTALGGCAKMDQLGWSLGTPEPAKEGSEASETGVYYTGEADIPLYKNPGNTLIKRLAEHTKVYRDDLKKGYAHVRVETTGEEGWVDNGKLIWRLPRRPEASKPVKPTEKGPDVEPMENAPLDEETSGPLKAEEPVTPSSTTDDPSVAPSIFNPY